ncbi:MAG: beta-xylanase [Isosphaeraceae bacterium]|jgi:acetyl esterase/lipase|nr:MAG: beta-xylanase [Isosphaeraceae bacterium]
MRIFLVGLMLAGGWTIPVAGQEPESLPLWPAGAPGALGNDPGEDPFHSGDIPTITVWLPARDRATGAAVVICPGGGYGFLATEHEGSEVAAWLNSIGVAGIMLKYRIAPRYRHPAPLEDAQRAMRLVRHHAQAWGIDPDRVGILGFSAGGHLASTVSTHFDTGRHEAADPVERQSCRPDFAILVYPVIALATEYGHSGSRTNLLGDRPDPALLASLSNETQVTPRTPPTFLVHTAEDAAVPPENSLLYASALRRAGVPFELHLFAKGVHGLGLGTGWKGRIGPEPSFQAWPSLCEAWLRGRGILDRPAGMDP